MPSTDLALLVPLDALLQEVSVTRAARRLGLSTPAMSHALARMRVSLGDPLLVRAGRVMVLTPRAEALKAAVHAVVTAAQQVLTPEQPFAPATLRRGFTLLATDHVLQVLGPALDRIVAAEAPHAALRFIPNTTDDAAVLRDGGADLAIGIYADLPPELRTRQLLTDRLVCAVREGHPRVGKRMTLDDFVRLQHVQIAPRGQPGGYLDDTLRAHGHTRHVARAVPYFLTALHLVAETDYVLTVAERLARSLAPRLGLRLLEPPIELRPYALNLMWHPRVDGDPAHRWLREALTRASRLSAGDRHSDARTRLRPTQKRRKSPAS